MKSQNEEIAQLQRDLQRANNANESMLAELEQLKEEVSDIAPTVGSRPGTGSRKSRGPSDQTRAERPTHK